MAMPIRPLSTQLITASASACELSGLQSLKAAEKRARPSGVAESFWSTSKARESRGAQPARLRART
jgi:hypothetical protein